MKKREWQEHLTACQARLEINRERYEKLQSAAGALALIVDLPARFRIKQRGRVVAAVGPEAEAYFDRCAERSFIVVPWGESRRRLALLNGWWERCKAEALTYTVVALKQSGWGEIRWDMDTAVWPSYVGIMPEGWHAEQTLDLQLAYDAIQLDARVLSAWYRNLRTTVLWVGPGGAYGTCLFPPSHPEVVAAALPHLPALAAFAKQKVRERHPAWWGHE